MNFYKSVALFLSEDHAPNPNSNPVPHPFPILFPNSFPISSGNNFLFSFKSQREIMFWDTICTVDGGLQKFETDYAERCTANHYFHCGDDDSLDPTILLNHFRHDDSKKETSSKNFVRFRKSTQDTSDLAFALKTIEEQDSGAEHPIYLLEVFGVYGGRKDHEIINLGVLINFALKQKTNFLAVLHPNSFILKGVPCVFDLPENTLFSMCKLPLGSFDDKTACWKIEGAAYEGQVRLTHPSQGLSNLSKKSRLILTPEDFSCIYVYFQIGT